MRDINVNKTLENILENEFGYDMSLIDEMKVEDRAEFCRLIAEPIQQWLSPYEPTFIHSIPSIIDALCHWFNVPFSGEVEPKFVRKPKEKGRGIYG